MTRFIRFNGETKAYECRLALDDQQRAGWEPIHNHEDRFFAVVTEHTHWQFVDGRAAPTPQVLPPVDFLPTDSAARKEVPLWTVISKYFPKAMIGVTRVSFKANERHNPGQPMHWSREKSSDHKDCIARHLLDEERIDLETGEPEAVQAAWRALANAELVIEKLQAEGRYHA